jgi:hypothetical protein
MSEITENPFNVLFKQMQRMEAMIVEMKDKLEVKQTEVSNRDDNGIDMAVRVTGYKKTTIYKLVNLREIPHSKHRNCLRFDEDTLRKWRKGRTRMTQEEAMIEA